MRELGDGLERLFRDGRTNALAAWTPVATLGPLFLESAVTLDYALLAILCPVIIVALLPPLAYRDWRVMLPWELLVIALAPLLVRAAAGGRVGVFAAYLSVAALALLVVVELDVFTDLRITEWFAVLFVIQTTLAAGATWSIARWIADQYLGTAYLEGNDALMIEWLWVAAAGVVAGIAFESYFARRDKQLSRVLGRLIGR